MKQANKTLYYEIVSLEGFPARIVGPLKWVYPVTSKSGKNSEYKYAQIKDGKILQAFRDHEIYITNKKLSLHSFK